MTWSLTATGVDSTKDFVDAVTNFFKTWDGKVNVLWFTHPDGTVKKEFQPPSVPTPTESNAPSPTVTNVPAPTVPNVPAPTVTNVSEASPVDPPEPYDPLAEKPAPTGKTVDVSKENS